MVKFINAGVDTREQISEIFWTGTTSQPEAHWAVHEAPQNGPILASWRLQPEYNPNTTQQPFISEFCEITIP